MSNIKNSNNYITLQSYNNCSTTSKDYPNYANISAENFGSFSIYAAVRPPYNASYFDSALKQPVYPGVN